MKLFLLLVFFISCVHAGNQIFRVCYDLTAFESCDFTTLYDAVNSPLVPAKSTIEICGPYLYDGPSTILTKQLHFVCGRCQPIKGKPKKDMTSKSKKSKLYSYSPSSSDWMDSVQTTKKKTGMKKIKRRNLMQNKMVKLQKAALSNSAGTASTYYGPTSTAQIKPSTDIFNSIIIGWGTGIFSSGTAAFAFAPGSEGSSVINCNIVCDPFQPVQNTPNSIAAEVGVVLFQTNSILIQNDLFDSCYYGVYVAESTKKVHPSN